MGLECDNAAMFGLQQTLILGAVLSILAGCGQKPFVINAPKVFSSSDRQVVSICHNANSTTREEIYKIVAKECEVEGSSLEFFHHEKLFNECPIFAKSRVSFYCIPALK